MAVERKLTVADFDAFIAKPENVDRLFELINGEIVEKVPTQRHFGQYHHADQIGHQTPRFWACVRRSAPSTPK